MVWPGCGMPGPEQAPKGALSILHWNVDPDSSEEKVKVGVVSGVVPVGPESIVVLGAVVSTVKLRVAGVWSVFEFASIARTRKV